MSEQEAQVRELVEEHLSRVNANDAGLSALLGGLYMIDYVIAVARKGTQQWGPVVLRLRQGIADTKAALKQTQSDATLERLRAFADRQLAFAEALEDELVSLEEDESTLA